MSIISCTICKYGNEGRKVGKEKEKKVRKVFEIEKKMHKLIYTEKSLVCR